METNVVYALQMVVQLLGGFSSLVCLGYTANHPTDPAGHLLHKNSMHYSQQNSQDSERTVLQSWEKKRPNRERLNSLGIVNVREGTARANKGRNKCKTTCSKPRWALCIKTKF